MLQLRLWTKMQFELICDSVNYLEAFDTCSVVACRSYVGAVGQNTLCNYYITWLTGFIRRWRIRICKDYDCGRPSLLLINPARVFS